jgi:hypothetical protein
MRGGLFVAADSDGDTAFLLLPELGSYLLIGKSIGTEKDRLFGIIDSFAIEAA